MNLFQGNLFTEYFLTEGIKHTYEWRKLEEIDFKSLFKEFEDIYLKISSAQNPDEADTEDKLIIPFFEKLEFKYLRKKSPQQRRRQDIPDFILFKDDVDLAEALKNKAKQWHLGKAILEAKRFKRALDRRDISDPFEKSVPSNQILRYLSSVETASNGKILWGILTNGQIWRLYYQKARSRIDDFLGVDLSKIFTNGLSEEKSINSFKIFYLFFRKAAFDTTNYRQDKTFLEYALEEGKNWEESVSESLKDKVFTEIFPLLAEGFLQDAKSKGEIINSKLLENIYNNTLILLYRILFVLYAEDRDLLPVRKPKYDDYSLRKLRKEIEIRIDNKDIFSRTASNFYGHLKNLFKIINWGDKSLETPPYNGGLFDPQLHSFLEKYDLSDYYIAKAIDYLSRDHSEKPAKRINYRDLTVRQLGSIYEGLLEFKLKIADEDLAVIREKGNEKYISKRELAGQKIVGEKKRGELYITNEKAARKATASYYTPDYIVQYIVENTIGTLVREKIENFKNRKDSVKRSSKFKGQTAKSKNEELKKFDPADAILNLKILDPAMGSGHFLVAALDYLADKVLEILDEYSQKVYFGKETYISPLISRLGDIRERVLEQARKAGYEIEHEKLEDKHIIKRIILKRCIYGVDLNHLAVELAKVSLWLHSFTIGAPLSFLDHHLKCGNSLIGVWDVSDVILQSSPRYKDFLVALNNMVHIQNIYDISLTETKESARLYSDFEKKLYPFIRKNNVSLAAKHFMGKITPNSIIGMEYKALDESATLPQSIEEKYEEAKIIANRKRFFHWKLEFPEVWYEAGREKIKGGFDVIMGNPPYLDSEIMTKKFPYERKCINMLFDSVYGNWDIYIPFWELSYCLLRLNGFASLITPNKWLSIDYAKKLRVLFSDYMIKIADYSKVNVFKEQAIYPIVAVISKNNIIQFNVEIFSETEKGVIKIKSIQHPITILKRLTLFGSWAPLVSEYYYLINKILNQNIVLLHEIIDVKEASTVSDAYKLQDIIEDKHVNSEYFKLVNTGTIDKYDFMWGIYPIKYIKQSYRFPSINKENLNRLLPLRYKQSQYEKLILAGMVKFLEASYDKYGDFVAGKSTVICMNKPYNKYKLLYILSIINSKLASFIFRSSYEMLGMSKGYINVSAPIISYFPIRCISFNTSENDLIKNVNKIKYSYQNYLSDNKSQEIIFFIIQSLQVDNEKSDLIHDFLAFLAEQMIEYNKEKHKESIGFLNWLEDYLGFKIDEMKNKTKIRAYHKVNWDEFWKILRDNKGKIRFDIARREHVEKIKGEFETSVSKLKPLKNKIELTDKLIDQIVYKLYNLTDEEIKIIEKAY